MAIEWPQLKNAVWNCTWTKSLKKGENSLRHPSKRDWKGQWCRPIFLAHARPKPCWAEPVVHPGPLTAARGKGSRASVPCREAPYAANREERLADQPPSGRGDGLPGIACRGRNKTRWITDKGGDSWGGWGIDRTADRKISNWFRRMFPSALLAPRPTFKLLLLTFSPQSTVDFLLPACVFVLVRVKWSNQFSLAEEHLILSLSLSPSSNHFP